MLDAKEITHWQVFFQFGMIFFYYSVAWLKNYNIQNGGPINTGQNKAHIIIERLKLKHIHYISLLSFFAIGS